MPSTHLSLHYHLIFSTKDRVPYMQKEWRGRLHAYLGGIVNDLGGVPEKINGVEDHVHVFLGLKPAMALSDLVRDIKNNSSNFINEQNWITGKFNWQEGYGAFSYSHSQIEAVYTYIQNQEQHHKQQTFKEEYLDFLKKFEIEHDAKYLFEWLE